eukprot:330296-Amphidinium_carterae.2
MDPFWSIDAELLAFMLGTDGATRLKEQWRVRTLAKALPVQDSQMAVEQSTEFMRVLPVQSIAIGVREELEGAHNMVLRVFNGEAVVTLGHTLTPWLTSVCKALEGFIYYGEPEIAETNSEEKKKEVKKDAEAPKQFYGQQALQMLLREVTSRPPADVLLKDLSVFVVFRHLLSDEDVAAIAKVRNSLMTSGVAAKAKSAPAKATKVAKSKAKASKDSQLDATARALLGMSRVSAYSLTRVPRHDDATSHH